MADEEDYSSIPLPDRFSHKVWKVRKAAYEEATVLFAKTADEDDPVFRPFLLDPSRWKGAVADSNVAAQQDGIAALVAFLRYGGYEQCQRCRSQVIQPLVEKALISTRAATKTNAIEALLLMVEIDPSYAIMDELLPCVSHKQPKVVAATLAAMTALVHNYGCKIIDPKPILKALPKPFAHADKNVRAEATNLTVELYRWLRDALKPMLWNDLKPTQQTDLEALFAKALADGPAKQERLLRSQQGQPEAAEEATEGAGDEEADGDDADDAGGMDAYDLAEPQDVLKKLPSNFYDQMSSTKWKDRKEALDAFYEQLKVPRIKDGDFGEVSRVLAKVILKDANVAVVTVAAQVLEALCQGLRTGYAKYWSGVMVSVLERLKEKKQTVSDALGAALDAIMYTTELSDCLELILPFLAHKNPQVKEGTAKFVVRCLRTTKTVPSKPEINSIVEAGKKLLSESTEGLRSGGAEILGTTMKIIGERGMTAHLDGIDDIKKNKIKEYFDTAEVKAKEKPKPAPAPAAKAPAARKGPPAKKAPAAAGRGGLKKPAASSATTPPQPAQEAAPAAAAAPARSLAGPGSSKPLGMPKTSGISSLKAPNRRPVGSALTSPKKPMASGPPIMPEEDDIPAAAPVAAAAPEPQSRLGGVAARGGVATRSLARAPGPVMPAAQPAPAASGLTEMERAERDELRSNNERLLRQMEDMRQERNKLLSEVQELKTQNAMLIEDHTRDVLSIKAKETQLVRARSDAEATEQTNDRLRRELERLKRALSRAEGLQPPASGGSPRSRVASPSPDGGVGSVGGPAGHGPGRPGSAASGARESHRMSYASHHSSGGGGTSGDEMMMDGAAAGEAGNGSHFGGSHFGRSRLSPELRYGGGSGSASSGRGSPARSYRSMVPAQDEVPLYPPDHASQSFSGSATASSKGREGGGSSLSYPSTSSSSGSTAHHHPGQGPMAAGGNSSQGGGVAGLESWKRAAEVTSQLKARIEQMKAKQAYR